MMPALHCAMTNSGPDTMNSGDPINGRRKRSKGAGKDIQISKDGQLYIARLGSAIAPVESTILLGFGDPSMP